VIDPEASGRNINSRCDQLIELTEKNSRIEHYTSTDTADGLGAKYP
jgi:hypothetical protein